MGPGEGKAVLERLRSEAGAAVDRWRRRVPVALLGAIVVVLLGAFAYAPLFGGGMILTADNLHAWRIHELGRCLDDGQIPCRWVPDLGNGYGFPLFNYYPPLPYYAGDLLHRLGFSYLRAVDALYLIGLAGAGLSMFVLTRRLWGDLGGLVSAVAYVYAPYLALDVYMRGALAELWGLAFAPALLWAIYELVTTSRLRFVPVVALLGAGLLLSHNLVAIIVAPAAVLWTVALLLSRGREVARPALLAGVAALWGIGLAAFFTLPVLFEGPHVQLDSVTQWPFNYGDHFASVNDLFLLRSSDYGFLLGIRDDTPVQIGWFHWAFAGLALPAGAALWWRGERRLALAVALFAAFFAMGAYMTLSASDAVWSTFESLPYIQFPWRYLGLVSLGAAALSGAWLALLRDRSPWLQIAVAAALIGLFIGSGRTFFQPLYRFDVSDADLFEGDFLELYQAGSIGDFLPKEVTVIPDPPTRPVQVVSGPAAIRSTSSGTDWITMSVTGATASRLQVSLFDYPNWTVRIDGEVTPHRASSPSGLVTFTVPPGRHQVEVRLEDTSVRRLANRISLASWSALVLAALGVAGAPLARRRRARRGLSPRSRLLAEQSPRAR